MGSNNRMPRRAGHMGGPMGGRGIVGEKPKDFKGTLVKTLRYMRSNLLAIIVAFVLAIGGVIATIFVPEIMGKATDELMTGVLRKQMYEAAHGVGAIVTDNMTEAAEGAASVVAGAFRVRRARYKRPSFQASRPWMTRLWVRSTSGMCSAAASYSPAYSASETRAAHWNRSLNERLPATPLSAWAWL